MNFAKLLKPKSQEEIETHLNKLSIEEVFDILIKACIHGHLETIKIILKFDKSLIHMTKGYDKNTPLHYAVAQYGRHYNLKAIELLIELGADIYAQNAQGRNPYSYSKYTIVDDLLEKHDIHKSIFR